ncbi:hypothetical protein [Streptomyces collinus]|uniref:hypothetical protein n=1 Tax=Streptomyces collinus TaxID=42684 RepID=UPI0033DF0034
MVEEETVEDRTVPDWRADAWHPERQHHEHYGKNAVVAVEITGPSGLADAVEARGPGPLASDRKSFRTSASGTPKSSTVPLGKARRCPRGRPTGLPPNNASEGSL